MNDRVKNFRTFISISERGKSIYAVRPNSQLKKDVLCLSLFSGAMIGKYLQLHSYISRLLLTNYNFLSFLLFSDWWVQKSIQLIDLVTDEEFSLWMEHLLFDQILAKHSFSRVDLDNLFDMIEKWRTKFRKTISYQAVRSQGTLCRIHIGRHQIIESWILSILS